MEEIRYTELNESSFIDMDEIEAKENSLCSVGKMTGLGLVSMIFAFGVANSISFLQMTAKGENSGYVAGVELDEFSTNMLNLISTIASLVLILPCVEMATSLSGRFRVAKIGIPLIFGVITGTVLSQLGASQLCRDAGSYVPLQRNNSYFIDSQKLLFGDVNRTTAFNSYPECIIDTTVGNLVGNFCQKRVLNEKWAGIVLSDNIYQYAPFPYIETKVTPNRCSTDGTEGGGETIIWPAYAMFTDFYSNLITDRGYYFPMELTGQKISGWFTAGYWNGTVSVQGWAMTYVHKDSLFYVPYDELPDLIKNCTTDEWGQIYREHIDVGVARDQEIEKTCKIWVESMAKTSYGMIPLSGVVGLFYFIRRNSMIPLFGCFCLRKSNR